MLVTHWAPEGDILSPFANRDCSRRAVSHGWSESCTLVGLFWSSQHRPGAKQTLFNPDPQVKDFVWEAQVQANMDMD